MNLLNSAPMIFALVVCFISMPCAWAQSENSARDRFRDIMNARNAGELIERALNEAELETSRRICEIQLDENRVPTTCFDVIEREKALNLISKSAFLKERSFLDQVCVRRSKVLNLADGAILHQRTLSLSPACRAAIEDRVKDLQYRAEVESPGRLFALRARPVQILNQNRITNQVWITKQDRTSKESTSNY